MKVAVYPGSFDPITLGHLDIIERASKCYDELYVAVMKNPSKNYTFSEDERVELIKKCVKKIKNVKVVIGKGLTVDFAKKLNVALSTINRWELNKVRPNVKAMKAIKQFCAENGVDYERIETEWLYPSENDKIIIPFHSKK